MAFPARQIFPEQGPLVRRRMRELGQETEYYNAEKNREDNEQDTPCLPITSANKGRIREIIDWGNLFQVRQIVQQVAHARVTLAWIAANRTHHKSRKLR